MTSFVRRMVGAAKLDPATYEEVEADKSATRQALGVVLLSAVAVTVGDFHLEDVDLLTKFLGGIVGWMIWVLFIWVVGVKLLPEAETRSNIGELVRTTGFASTPGLFRSSASFPGWDGWW